MCRGVCEYKTLFFQSKHRHLRDSTLVIIKYYSEVLCVFETIWLLEKQQNITMQTVIELLGNLVILCVCLCAVSVRGQCRAAGE